jgi:nuclease S1
MRTTTRVRFAALMLVFLAMCGAAQPVRAWGCKGHQTIALIAEKHLTPEARAFVEKLLSENPVDPQLKRYCGTFAGDLLADGSTWPDDARKQLKNGPWHYIDIPRGAPRKPLEEYCGEEGCVTKAIADQWAILKDPMAPAAKRAEALRYVTHFVGDLHMPLHATTNNDMGGNCVPVKYFWRSPHANNNSFVPNLHALWDSALVERDMAGADPADYAAFLEETFSPDIEKWTQAGIHVEEWAWQSHDLAETVTYSLLSPKVPTEAVAVVHSCTDADNIGKRMLDLHVSAGDAYVTAAAGVVEQRLEQAGVRLALLLNEAAKPVAAQK